KPWGQWHRRQRGGRGPSARPVQPRQVQACDKGGRRCGGWAWGGNRGWGGGGPCRRAGPTSPGPGVRQRRPAVRVLVVEDEQVLAEAIARGLRRQGMAVDLALDGAEALDKAAVNHYDVIVLDRDLPGVHGDQVCRRLATQGASTRILMLTAAGTVDDRVQGLDLGADDYLCKPFALRERGGGGRGVGRRSAAPPPPVLARGDLVVDPAKHEAQRGGHFLRLTRKELGVLEELLAAQR